jgi:hypothetical protein
MKGRNLSWFTPPSADWYSGAGEAELRTGNIGAGAPAAKFEEVLCKTTRGSVRPFVISAAIGTLFGAIGTYLFKTAPKRKREQRAEESASRAAVK